jgi:hypothetical protein
MAVGLLRHQRRMRLATQLSLPHILPLQTIKAQHFCSIENRRDVMNESQANQYKRVVCQAHDSR